MKILLVEDKVSFLRRMQALLAGIDGIEVTTARSVGEALCRLREGQPAAVLLDLRLPDGTGLDVLRAVKGCSGPPVAIMVTSADSRRTRQRFESLGGDYFFDKLTEIDKLLDLLRDLRNRRARSRESQASSHARTRGARPRHA